MKSLIRSFGYAFCGIGRTVTSERNMRIHLTVMAYMFGYLFLYDFFTVTRTQLAILFVMCAAVISGELINTAIENIADLVEKNKSIFVRNAKDAAAGAVLVTAISAVAVGIAVLYQPDAFRALFDYYMENPVMIAVLIASLAVSLIFIFMPFKKKNRKD